MSRRMIWRKDGRRMNVRGGDDTKIAGGVLR